MKCSYCAEEIQPDAIVCRFCGAERRNGEWTRVSAAAPREESPGGAFLQLTVVTSGVMVIFGAVSDLLSLGEAVPLFGALRGGVVAALYHLVMGGLFLVVGVGMVARKLWSWRALWIASALFTVDRLLFLADPQARAVYAQRELHSDLFASLISPEELSGGTAAAAGLELLSWWLFVLYLYRRREYFLGRPQ